MARRAAIRASDEDRELIADRLRQATGEGRLLAGELEERLEVAFTARTVGQLAALVSDLPGPGRGRGLPIWARATLGLAGAVGVMAAAAMAALLFSLIAGVSAALVVLDRVILGKGGRRDRRGGHPRNHATRALRQPEPRTSVPRGGRALLP